MKLSEIPGAWPAAQSATAGAVRERLEGLAPGAAPPATSPETARAVSPTDALEDTRLMLERPGSESQVSAFEIGAMTAALLTEMRLNEELRAIQEELSK